MLIYKCVFRKTSGPQRKHWPTYRKDVPTSGLDQNNMKLSIFSIGQCKEQLPSHDFTKAGLF